MRMLAVEGLLGLVVVCAWLALIGALRMRGALDRLHAATLVSVACVGGVFLAAAVQEGLSDRTLKVLFLFLLTLVGGGGVTHAIGRALAGRPGATLR